MATQTRTAFVFVVAGSLLAAFGIVQGIGEAETGATANGSPIHRFNAMVAGGYDPGASRRSKNLVIADCLDLPADPLVRIQPDIRREEFARQCLDAARTTVAEMPTYSAGWLALASASADLGRVGSFLRALVISQRVGPEVHWLGERRIAMASSHAGQLDDAAREAYRLDLLSLLRSGGGIEVVASRYVRDPDGQQAILSVAETAPADAQQTFLARVQELSGQGGQ